MPIRGHTIYAIELLRLMKRVFIGGGELVMI